MCPLPDCDNEGCFVVPPAMDEFNCAPAVSDGEVTEILMTSTPFTTAEMSSAVDFAARIDNDVTVDTAVVRLKVTGSLPEPEVTETEVEGGVTVISARKKFSVNFEFSNDSANNYEAARYLMHCGKPMIVYFVMGGRLYGGTVNVEDGIPTVVSIKPSSEGRDSFLKYIGAFSWRATTLPMRTSYLLAS